MRHPIFFSIAIGFLGFFAILPARAQWVQTNGPVSAFCFTAIGPNLFAGVVGAGVFRSTDDGANWAAIDSGLTSYQVVALAGSGSNLFTSTIGGGVFLSTNNGTSWKAVNSGLVGGVFAFAVSGPNLFAGTNGDGVYLSGNNGTSWKTVNNGLTNLGINALAVSGSNLFAGTSAGSFDTNGVFLSKDNGASWSVASTGYPTFEGVNAFAVSGTNIFAAASDTSGVYHSTDNGTRWTAINNGLPDTIASALAVSGTNLFAATEGDGIFRSTNNGTSWSAINNGLTDLNIYSLAVIGPYLVTGTDSGVWRLPISELLIPSHDTEAAPLQKDTSLVLSGDSASARGHRIDFVNRSSNTLTIIGAGLTVADNRFSISKFLPGVPDTVLPNDTFSMIVNFFGDDSGTVYPDTIMLTIDPDEEISSYYVYLKGNSFSAAPSGVSQISPGAFPNLQIYPNPFSQSTQITFTSQAAGYTEVSIVNLLGVEVVRLFSGELGAGEHSFLWGKPTGLPGLPDGTYECLVRMNGQVETLPVVLMH